MEKDFLARFYMLSSLLAGIAGDYAEEFIMLDNDKLRGYSVSLVGEIDELLNNGKTKEDCLKLLDIRYKLFIERKSKNLVDLDDDYVVIDDDGNIIEKPYTKKKELLE